jgi:uncharacterized membrane protein
MSETINEKRTEEILELARQRIMERREQEQIQQETVFEERTSQERVWRYAWLAAVGGLLAALLFTPGMSLDEKMYAVLHGLCSQEHNIILGGLQFPICARCSGIYLSVLITMGYFWVIGRGRAGRIPPWSILITILLFVVAMGIDGINSMFEKTAQTFYTPRNELRVITGLGMGVAMGVLLHMMINLSLRSNVNEEQPVLATWREFLGLLGLNFLVLVAIYGNLSFLAWPLAFLAFSGMIWVIYVVNVILMSLILGYDGAVTRLTQLARPATLAIIPTLLLIAAFTSLRYWLEAQGIMIQ